MNCKEIQQDKQQIRVTRSMHKLEIDNMTSISNTTHIKAKAKPGSRITERNRFKMGENYQRLHTASPRRLNHAIFCL